MTNRFRAAGCLCRRGPCGPLLQSRTNSRRTRAVRIIRFARRCQRAVRAGRTRSQTSALLARAGTAGIDDNQLHPALQRRAVAVRGSGGRWRGCSPQDRQPLLAMVRPHPPPPPRYPRSRRCGRWRARTHSAWRSHAPAAEIRAQTMFGVPNAFISRRTKTAESAIAVVEGA